MQSNFRQLLGITSFGIIVSGCASGPVIEAYRAPDPSSPSAQLAVIPPEYLGRHDTEELNRHDSRCQLNGEQNRSLMRLARFDLSDHAKPVVVAVPDGRSYFQYMRMGNSESCTINFSAQLEAGHAYAFKTEVENKGWLKGKNCLVGMFDAKTGLPVALDYEGATPSHPGMCVRQAQR